MRVGIVGFPGSGKSTIFESLAPGSAAARGQGPALGNIKVPDNRVDFLTGVHSPKKVTYAEVTFVDVPGGGDPRAGALSTDVVTQMRSVDLLVHVVRGFVSAYSGDDPAPDRDVANFESELILADLAVVEKRLERLIKENTRDAEFKALSRCAEVLNDEVPLRRAELDDEESRLLRGFQLLSTRPLITLFNLDEEGWGDPEMARFREPAEAGHAGELAVGFCGLMEAEVAGLPEDEQGEFLEAYGLGEPARLKFIQQAYAFLDQISFLTMGPDECRAWPIRRGTPAVRAAGKVHSDIERGFIRAEVIAFDDFVELRSEAAARKAGKMGIEGKTYVVRDGDIINFRFNV